MPTIKWNKNWVKNLTDFKRGRLQGSYYGDQWGDPEHEPMLKQVVKQFISPYIRQQANILEIGPGGGRWTQYLLACEKLYCVELNPEMFDYLDNRFPEQKHFSFILTNGSDFPGIPASSVDFVFSFGTLVHLDFSIIREYIKNLSEIMRYNGNISIQFSNKKKPMANKNPDFSDNSPEQMIKLLELHDFCVTKIDDNLLPHSTIISAQYQGE